jgi:hypothetical protein
LGLLLAAWLTNFARHAAHELRRTARSHDVSPGRLLAQCALVSYLVEIFVRSTGYFSSTSILLVAAIWFLRNDAAAHRQ